ncbi:MAG TPA: hypothetical protein VGH96_04975 [Streptosporangiaceae bacterium]
MTAISTPALPQVPRHIKVNGHRIHLRLVQQLIWSFAAATAGAYIISALYYLIIQVHWSAGSHTILYLRPQWNGLFATKWWPQARHDFRDVYEGALATLFVKSLLANWKEAHSDKVGAFRLITAPLLIIVAALPIVVVGIWVLNFAGPWVWHHTEGHRVLHLTVSMPAWLGTFLSTWNWQPLLIGIITGLVVHRLYRPIGNTIQLFFIELGVNRARSTGQVPAWVLHPITPPVIRERFAWMMDNDVPIERHGAWIRIVTPIMTAILILLALYGAYIRLWFAKHGTPGHLF